jgi:cytochrome c oxidase assembly factor CtaG
MTDQQWAAGMMWMVGSLPLSAMLFVIIGRIAGDEERPARRARHRSATVHVKGV